MSKSSSAFASAAPTPAPSSPPRSESYLSDIDGTAPSVLDSVGGDYSWEAAKVDPATLNLVSWKLDVNARAEDGVDKRGFNAISTVLNHPTRKANPLRASRKPLPPLATPDPVLPKPPPPSYYDSYLQCITPLYDNFIAAQASSSRPVSVLGDFDSRPSATVKADLPPLSSVPDCFFDPTFDLAQPSIWSDVADGFPEAGSSTPIPVNQDVLSTHLDTLERHLIHEITLRSSAFFSALSNLQDLHSESASCLSRISDLQVSLKEVGSNQARRGLEVIEAQEHLRVLRVTERGVKTVAELEELLRITRGLVDAGDWAGGLSCVGDIIRWWERHDLDRSRRQENGDVPPEPPDRALSTASFTLPLSTLPGLLTLPSTVTEYTATIAIQLVSAISSLLLSTLSKSDVQVNLDARSFRSQVEPMLEGLVKCGKVDGVQEVWREITTTSIREGSRKHLPVPQAEEEGDVEGKPPEMRGASLADSLKSMSHSGFLLLSAQMYETLLARLGLAHQIGETLSSILKTARDIPHLTISASALISTPLASTRPGTPAPIDFADVLSSACELANTRASKILAVRSEQHAGLGIAEFVEIFRENWDFVVATEQLAKRMIVSLRGVTASQARVFLITYHSQRLTRSAKFVEEEQWSQIDVSPDTQHVVNLLIKAAVEDPKECLIPPPAETLTNGVFKEGGKVLNIEDKTYFVVKATAESLTLLGDYLKVVINLEMVVTDVMARIIEFLKSFNSRTCQVVLGAGAMRSAGLKNITAKHLALASQSLSIVVALIPYIREFIRRHLSLKQAVMLTEFDKLKRDYQEHQHEIHAKLVAIMSDRLAVHVASLRTIDWEAATDFNKTHEYAEMLVKETATLHKVLSKYLASQTVEAVISEVLAAIVHRMSEELAKVELKSEDAKKRMTTDVAFVTARLSPLSEAGKQVASLETLVKDKPTPRKPMGETMKGLLRRNTSVNTSPPTVKAPTTDDEEVEDEDGPGIVEEAQGVEERKSVEVPPADDTPPSAITVTEAAQRDEPANGTTAIPLVVQGDIAASEPIAVPEASAEIDGEKLDSPIDIDIAIDSLESPDGTPSPLRGVLNDEPASPTIAPHVDDPGEAGSAAGEDDGGEEYATAEISGDGEEHDEKVAIIATASA